MERISLKASEEMLFENVDRPTDDGRMDAQTDAGCLFFPIIGKDGVTSSDNIRGHLTDTNQYSQMHNKHYM